ncbi:MAG: hypothetical protein IPN77_11355 [Sandaracinaceae bacterium]|nr:hypothetical protein [Sandaracinaceae bacterium]
MEILDALRGRGAQMPFLFVSGYHESPTLRARMEELERVVPEQALRHGPAAHDA